MGNHIGMPESSTCHASGLGFHHPRDDAVMPDLILEAAALPYRILPDGTAEILVISSSSSRSWVIPKGKLQPDTNFSENAAREAWEEAGLRGTVSPTSCGHYRRSKRGKDGLKRVCEIWVYRMLVLSIDPNFPERGKRTSLWLPPDAAAQRLAEPALVAACGQIKDQYSGKPAA